MTASARAVRFVQTVHVQQESAAQPKLARMAKCAHLGVVVLARLTVNVGPTRFVKAVPVDPDVRAIPTVLRPTKSATQNAVKLDARTTALVKMARCVKPDVARSAPLTKSAQIRDKSVFKVPAP